MRELSDPLYRDLAAAWLCDEGAGQTLVDRGPYGVHATLTGGARVGTDAGAGLSLPNTTDFARASSENLKINKNQVGLSLWIRSDATQNDKGIVGDYITEPLSWLCWLLPTSGNVGFTVRADSTSFTANSGVSDISRWTHVACSVGSANGNFTTVWVNGARTSEGSITTRSVTVGQGIVDIGRRSQADSKAVDAELRDILFFRRSLTDHDVHQLRAGVRSDWR